jgi:hypothetical protein
MHRWEGVAAGGPVNWSNITDAQIAQAVAIAVNDLNFTRARLEIHNGAEGSSVASNPARYTPVNDNADPNVLDITKFDFSFLDHAIDRIVLPLRQAAQQAGKTLYTDLRYVDHIANTPFEHWRDPAEYGEFMLAVFTHMRDRYGFVPDSINVVNEPDNFTDYAGQGDKIGRMIVAAATRLQAAGFAVPAFAAPSVAAMANAPGLFDGIGTVPGAMARLTELSYHRYNSTADPNEILSRAWASGKRTAMLEKWDADGNAAMLVRDLTEVWASAWEQSQFIDNSGCQFNQILAVINGVVDYCPNTRLIRQYTKHVHPGAQRIGAVGTGAVQPVAFVNTDGSYVVVVKGSGPFTVSGLPPGAYGQFYSTASAFNVQLPDVLMTLGGLLSASLPEEGVLTIHSRTVEAPPPAASPPPPPTSPLPPIDCPLPDPFAVLGGGTCVGGNWLPPGYPGGTAAPPPPSPPTAPPSIPCVGPDPFVSLGGGICFNGQWFPPGYPIPSPPATTPPPTSLPPPTSPPPPSAAGCTTLDPFVSLGGGVCLNGNWLPPSYPGTESPTEPPTLPASPTPGGCPGSDPFASLITLIGRCVNGDWLPVPAVKTNGTVGFFAIGAGLWAIVGPDGTVYEPVGGLDPALRIQNLSVYVQAELTAGTSAYPSGVLVTIHSIVPNLPAP